MVPWFLNIAIGMFPLGPIFLSIEYTCEYSEIAYFHLMFIAML